MSFVVYRSSAGSGKTFTLVREYLKILLDDPSGFRHILAITFTNKAANEMKERVLDALQKLSEHDENQEGGNVYQLLLVLEKDSGLPRHEIASRAREALKLILHRYSEFAIGTIDSFSHRVIRTFAHDFRIPIDFEVDMDADRLLSTAVDLLLERAGEQDDLTRLLVQFLETRMDEEQGWNVAEIFSDFAKNLLDEQGVVKIESLQKISLSEFRRLSSELYLQIRIFESKLKEIASGAILRIRQAGVETDQFYNGDKGIGKYFLNLADGRFDKIQPNSYVVKTITEDKWTAAKTDSDVKKRIDELKPFLIQQYDLLMQLYDNEGGTYQLRKLLAGTIYPLAVLSEIEKTLSAFKQQNNLVHISEFNARIAGVIMNEPVPFIYERLGEKYHHILIDEFQDTSVLQWMNFIPLIENSLAGGYFNLVVGDGKQAIYRWRGGDIEQFNALPAIPGSDANPLLKQREQSLSNHYALKYLERNFRSKAEIIQFNNTLFKILADRLLNGPLKAVYQDIEQHYDEANSGGFVSLEFIGDSDDGLLFEESSLERIFTIITDLTTRGYHWKDIAVLTRSNLNGSRVAAFLLSKGIDVVSSESLLIKNSLKVKFLIALLKLMFEPSNDIVREEIRVFLDSWPAQPASRDGDVDFRQFSRYPVYELCEALIRHYQLDKDHDAYLLFFLDVVLQFAGKKSHNPVDFLEYWKDNQDKFSLVVPEEMDAVKIMTIHKAKGLQFPAVIFPFATENRRNTRSWLWLDLEPDIAPGLESAIVKNNKELENTIFRDQYREEQEKSMLDLLNVLYVALTRAEEQLYILTSPPPEKVGEVDSIPKFFHHYLKTTGQFIENQSRFEFGQPLQRIKKNIKPLVETIPLNYFISNEWESRVKVRTRLDQEWVSGRTERSEWGTRVHAILSRITKGGDLAEAINQAIIAGTIEQAEAKPLENKLRELVNHPQLKELYSDNCIVRNEPEILAQQGSFYRPDRVVVKDGTATIIDYKTGEKRPEHAIQLEKYGSLVATMGYKSVRCLLIYLEPEIEVVEL